MQISAKRALQDETLRSGEGDQRELYKKFKFDQTNKWYMQNPEFILENETHKILWVFFCDTNGSPNLGQTIRSRDNQ